MRIVTLNMWGRSAPWQARYRLAGRALAALRADVVCLQEVDDGDALDQLARATGLVVAVADPAVSALAVLVPRRPRLRATEIIDLRARSPQENRPRRLCAVHFDEYVVACTHLSWRADDAATRWAQAEEIALHLPAPTVVCGDFNCPPDAHALTPLTTRFVDVLAGTPAAARPTWDNRNPHTAPYRASWPDMRIDLVLADPALLERHPCREAAVVLDTPGPGGLYPSDHFGVLVDLARGPSLPP